MNPTQNNNSRINITMDVALKEALLLASQCTGLSVSGLISQATRAFLLKNSPGPRPRTRTQGPVITFIRVAPTQKSNHE